MKVGLIPSVAIVAAAAFTPLASASLLAYDGFDTSNASGTALSSATDNDSTGWNGQWTEGGTGGNLATGLTYSQSTPTAANYPSSGQSVIFSASSSNLNYRSIATASQVSPSIGNTLWVSFLMNNATSNSHGSLSLISAGSVIGDIGTDNTAYYGLDNGAPSYSFSSSSAAVVAGQTALLVGEITYTGASTSTLNLWVDPDFTASTPGSPMLSISLSTAKEVGQLRLFDSGSSVGNITYDEIQFGNNYSDVVPEPAAMAMLIPVGALLATRRRRRAAS